MKVALKKLISWLNRVTERFGLRLQPVHYYSEVPDRRWLSRNKAAWAHPVSLHGVEFDFPRQLGWLAEQCGPYLSEVAGLAAYETLARLGPGYGPIESQVLHCVVRTLAPARLLEIGSGVTTAISQRAAALNASDGRSMSAITCVDPRPSKELLALPGVEVITQPFQLVPAERFASLRAGDLLFIDSTHTVRTGSEVIRLYLEVIPALPAGVLIHVHDIYLPYLYRPTILDELFDWQETALVSALLTDNPRLEVLACLSALHLMCSTELLSIIPDYVPATSADGLSIDRRDAGHWPASLWLRTR